MRPAGLYDALCSRHTLSVTASMGARHNMRLLLRLKQHVDATHSTATICNNVTALTCCQVQAQKSFSHYPHTNVKQRDVENKSEYIEFKRVLPDIVRQLTESRRHKDAPSATQWFAKVLQYNLTGGKKNRGLAVVNSYRLLAPDSAQTPQNVHLAQVMGWCLEMLHTSLLMAEDTLLETRSRRGKPCWYLTSRLQSAPRVAFNDAALIQTGVYQLLYEHFRHAPYYVDVMELFHDVSHKAVMGQVLDVKTRLDKSLDEFTMERYQVITKYRKAYHSFQMPVSLAMYMAGITDPEMHRQAKNILLEMGEFYQVLEDYIDCYGAPSLLGRQSTAIEDARCTWLAVVALQRATKIQRATMQACYGSREPEKIDTVKSLYYDLGLPSTFKIYEEQNYELLCTQIQQVSRGLPHKLFFMFLDRLGLKQPYEAEHEA